jgi:hypothetical protein
MFWIALSIIVAGFIIAYAIAHSRDYAHIEKFSKYVFRYNFIVDHISLKNEDFAQPNSLLHGSISNSLLQDKNKEVQVLKGLQVSVILDEENFSFQQNTVIVAKQDAENKASAIAAAMMGLSYDASEHVKNDAQIKRRFVECKFISIEQILI